MDQIELVDSIIHAIAGKNSSALLFLCQLMVAQASVLDRLEGMLGWFCVIDPEAIQWKIALRPEQVSLIRIAQFEIASHENNEIALQAANALISATALTDTHSVPTDSIRFLALGRVLLNFDVHLGIQKTIHLMEEMIDLTPRIIHARNIERDSSDAEFPLDEDEYIANIGLTLVKRIKTAYDLRELWGTLDNLTDNTRSKIIAKLDSDPAAAQLVVNGPWLFELHSDAADWNMLLEVLTFCYSRSVSWGALVLAASVATVSVRTLNENINSQLRAVRFAKTALREIGLDARLLDALADACEWRKKLRAAQKIRNISIELWKDSKFDDLGPSLALRKNARVKGKLENWVDSSSSFEEAASLLAENSDHIATYAGLLADAGHASVKAGDRKRAVQLFSKTATVLASVQNDPSDPRGFRIHKLFGMLMMWASDGVRVDAAGNGISEFKPGTCSDFEIAKDLTNLPATPLSLSIIKLCNYAKELIYFVPDLEKQFFQIKNSSHINLRVLALEIEAKLAARRCDIESVLILSILRGREMSLSLQYFDRNSSVFFEERSLPFDQKISPACNSIVEETILSTFLIMQEHNLLLSVSQQWIESVNRAWIGEDLYKWFEMLSELGLLHSSEKTERFLMSKKAQTRPIYCLYSLAICEEKSVPFATILHAHIALYQAMCDGYLYREFAPSLAKIVARYWRSAIEQPFRLTAPRLTVPDLERAVSSDTEGLPKVATILKAAIAAVGRTSPQWLLMLFARSLQGE